MNGLPKFLAFIGSKWLSLQIIEIPSNRILLLEHWKMIIGTWME